jgi:hypothetical protein
MIGASLSSSLTKKLNKKTVFAFDNDETGHCKSLEYVGKGFRVFIWPQNIGYKDFNEMKTDGYRLKRIRELIESHTSFGIEAKVRLLSGL